jgi:hypothetical protein
VLSLNFVPNTKKEQNKIKHKQASKECKRWERENSTDKWENEK